MGDDHSVQRVPKGLREQFRFSFLRPTWLCVGGPKTVSQALSLMENFPLLPLSCICDNCAPTQYGGVGYFAEKHGLFFYEGTRCCGGSTHCPLHCHECLHDSTCIFIRKGLYQHYEGLSQLKRQQSSICRPYVERPMSCLCTHVWCVLTPSTTRKLMLLHRDCKCEYLPYIGSPLWKGVSGE